MKTENTYKNIEYIDIKHHSDINKFSSRFFTINLNIYKYRFYHKEFIY